MSSRSAGMSRAAWSRPAGAAAPVAPVVLVAEDEESSRSALCDVLRDAGYDALGVADGLELVELAAHLRPAAVVLDLAMPRLNGMETASALRSHPSTREARILAVTASWLAERADLLAAAGFDGALRKPCSGERLVETLAHLLESDETRERQAGAGANGADPPGW